MTPADVADAIAKLHRLIPAEAFAEDDPGFAIRVAAYALAMRTVTLCDDTLALVGEGRALASMIVGRSTIECAALFHYIDKRLAVIHEKLDFEGLVDLVKKAGLGRRDQKKDNPHFTEAINILTCLGGMGKLVPSVEKTYLYLSEYAHPNYFGVSGFFSKLTEVPLTAKFGTTEEDAAHAFDEALKAAWASAHLSGHLLLAIVGRLDNLRKMKTHGGGNH